MKTNIWKSLGVTSALLLTTGAVTANAQDKAKSAKAFTKKMAWHNMYGDPISLASIPAEYMKSNLNLSDDQVSRIQAIQAKAWEKMKAERPSFGVKPVGDVSNTRMLPTPLQMRVWESDRMAAEAELSQEIKSTLTEEQRANAFPLFLKETSALAMAGLPVEALGELNLTSDQKQKIISGYESVPSDKRISKEAERDLDPEEKIERRAQFHKDRMDSLMPILTDAQKETLKQYDMKWDEKLDQVRNAKRS